MTHLKTNSPSLESSDLRGPLLRGLALVSLLSLNSVLLFSEGLSAHAQTPPVDWSEQSWDVKTSAEWYRIRAEAGDGEAAWRLAELYEQGIGVDKDLKAAARWYEVAAEKGDQRAARRLADFHARGVFGQADFAQAAKWYQRAAEAGDAFSAYNLARFLENGIGIKRDRAAAQRFYEQAWSGGIGEAALARGLMELTQGQPNAFMALVWCLRAQKLGVREVEDLVAQLQGQLDPTELVQARRLADQD